MGNVEVDYLRGLDPMGDVGERGTCRKSLGDGGGSARHGTYWYRYHASLKSITHYFKINVTIGDDYE
jgi:hypothetical protein